MDTVLPTVLGAGLILAVARDLVHELFHPESRGSISRWVMHGVWRGARRAARYRRSFIYQAGPMALIGVALVWTALVVAGWALIYLPRLPADFLPAPGLPDPATRGFHTAMYVSLASLTTLSASDLTPQIHGRRYMTAGESLFGLVMITAWITWVLSIYPVLAERRSFMREVALMREVHPSPEGLVRDAPAEAVTELLRSFAERILHVGTRLAQSRITYYFQNARTELALATQLPYVLQLARVAQRPGTPSTIRHNGELLQRATESVLDEIGEQFLGLRDAPPDEVIAALARDHLLDRVEG